MSFIKRNYLWIIYFLLVIIAISYRSDEHIFSSNGPFPFGKYLIWAMYLGLLGYSLYCSTVENFFKTLKNMSPMKWARQIGLDLYAGLILGLGLIYLVEGSILILLLWLIPTLVYGNLTILLYVALNYDSIISNFA